ncbi:pseudouridylate synthase PUS7L [Erpetoichthys calabaricus]|uniref:Pseudouridylate synthase PUS7L n=1 Tax=Erpetoichthys calabaricus TaxID=27687 RepID=A0A8C4RF33_ERPCA|nr:pseudouridylate synthase PUS7L [Erpetoichthys calabaricus]
MDEGEYSTSCSFSKSSINYHIGFLGSIKKHLEDFVVAEISLNGNLDKVTDSQSEVPESSEMQSCNNKQRAKMQHLEDLGSPGENVKISNTDLQAFQINDTALPSEDVLDLDFVLGDAVSEAVVQFVMLLKSPDCKSDISQNLSLGFFPDKNQRTIIHRAIRQRFPFLMTITNQNEIVVKEDPCYKELHHLVSEEESDKFFQFLDSKIKNSTFTFQNDDNKEHRKAIHHFLNKNFGKLVETKSFMIVDECGHHSSAVNVRFREKNKPSRKRTSAQSQEDDVTYTGFTLHKENLETLEAVGHLASLLGVLPSDFSYAGIKDKRAITYQTMVVKKVTPERLKELSHTVQKKGISISNIHPTSQPLRLGHLAGNHFDIIVRDVKKKMLEYSRELKDLVCEAVENVKVKGFVNYYGPQRFGSVQSVKADQIGLALLKKEMVKAVKLFFTAEGNDPVCVAKKHFLETEDAKETLALMPNHKVRERMILRAINRFGFGEDGCTQGWLSIPHGMRLFYIHACCSQIWNEAASYRIQTYGNHVVQGDLVFNTTYEDNSGLSCQEVHVVSAKEATDNFYSIVQVVLPMPGNNIKYPENKLGDWYKETLKRHGLELCKFRINSLKLNIPGCYRRLLAFPKNLKYQLHETNVLGTNKETILANDLCPNSDSLPYLSLSFDLNPSCYATVCLQEIMKSDL